MGKELARRRNSPARTPAHRNYMAFPRELRDAIPDLHSGRSLELDSITGQGSHSPLLGPRVQLKLLVKETGKLRGEFVVRMDLQPDAARKLAAELAHWADHAEKRPPAPDWN